MIHREGVTTLTHDWSMVNVASLVEKQKVIEIDGALPVEEACDILIHHAISSAPIYTTEQVQDSPSKTSYIGMFDYGDVIAYLLLVLKSMPPQLGPSAEVDFVVSSAEVDSLEQAKDVSTEIHAILRLANQGKSVPVKLASDLSHKNAFYSLMPETTLLSAVEEFGCGTHRVCVMNPQGTLKGILSQSVVLRYLHEHQKQFPEIVALFNKTLRELHLGETPVISVSSDATVLEALSLMNTHGISSLAVLGPMGVVLGNISLTDVKHVIKSYRYQLLWKTCFQCVSLVRTQQGIDDGQDRLPVFDVRLDTTLGLTVAKLLATKTHRVWVTDERDRAAGVVSLTDIMRTIAKYHENTVIVA
ncbi:hypothetical protein BDF14DRAFT_1798257 [Spinellus fusiger]|nr:hypothetical protein BDF14DRAFT_1798257 [Spinellus fusiger]